MEALVVLGQYRNQYHHKSKNCSPSGLREINCRFFQSDSGIRPNQFRTSVGENPNQFCSPQKTLKTQKGKSNAIPIACKDGSLINEFALGELWAGPAYANSPPPSSLPIPKFSLRQKRSTSFELPSSSPVETMRTFAKSAPPSPGRGDCCASKSFLSVVSATKDLRRILHLDECDE
ncbi:hypothetical protein Syun_007286 [Stephania yunnanensis]|uniref:Uncharacterized protein n=1 Tax=Stephania yunnanensis TaxID=152371 RepID=A0AAP0PZ89_9MAGN